MYGIYDTKENEQCVGIFLRIKDIAKYFNTSSHSISSTICRGGLRKHRYLIKKIEFNVEKEN
jgi:hypothetical protein